MGRKKRKIGVGEGDGDTAAIPASIESEVLSNPDVDPEKKEVDNKVDDKPKQASGYAMTSHSGEIIQEDIYISDGSESDQGENGDVDIVLMGSRLGIMRRGLHHPSMLVQPNRQWTRQKPVTNAEDGERSTLELTEEQRRQKEEEVLAKLDPAERAARLLQEKQRKLEEQKELERRQESEENAGRDSALFSKRTAFDIRFDQIEDKPWLRGNGDVSDFFNYGMTEEDWLEYSQQQLIIRQELIDARRQKRQPDPTIVPVKPRTPLSQNPRVAVNVSLGDPTLAHSENEDGTAGDAEPVGPSIGPERPDKSENVAMGSSATTTQPIAGPDKPQEVAIPAGTGGAWGAGAAPGSVLARLIEEQEQRENAPVQPPPSLPGDRRTSMSSSVDQDGGGQYGLDSSSVSRRPPPNKYYDDGGGSSARPPDSYGSNVGPQDAYYADPGGSGNVGPPGNYHGGSNYYGDAGNAYYADAGSHSGQPDSYYADTGSHSGQPDGYYGDGSGYQNYPPPPPPPPQYQDFRGKGGRGYDRYGGRGGRGGRGPPPSWEGHGGGGDYYDSRKRPREGGDPRWQR